MIHAVWGTKNREGVLNNEFRAELFAHIVENAKSKGVYIDTINGYTDHVHCLFALPVNEPIAKVLQLIKGESSYWINKTGIVKGKFSWADEYYAASVSESQLEKVRLYIRNQEEHHKKITFADEFSAFLKKHNTNGG